MCVCVCVCVVCVGAGSHPGEAVDDFGRVLLEELIAAEQVRQRLQLVPAPTTCCLPGPLPATARAQMDSSTESEHPWEAAVVRALTNWVCARCV